MSLNRHSHAVEKQLACGHALLRIQTYAGHTVEGGLMSFVHGMWSCFQPSQAANSRAVNPARKKGKPKKAKTAAAPRGVGSALASLHPQTSEMATEMAGVATVEASEMAAATVTVAAVQTQTSGMTTVEKSGLAVSNSSARFASEVSEALYTFAGP